MTGPVGLAGLAGLLISLLLGLPLPRTPLDEEARFNAFISCDCPFTCLAKLLDPRTPLIASLMLGVLVTEIIFGDGNCASCSFGFLCCELLGNCPS